MLVAAFVAMRARPEHFTSFEQNVLARASAGNRPKQELALAKETPTISWCSRACFLESANDIECEKGDAADAAHIHCPVSLSIIFVAPFSVLVKFA